MRRAGFHKLTVLVNGKVNTFLKTKRTTVCFLVQYGLRFKNDDEEQPKPFDGIVNGF